MTLGEGNLFFVVRNRENYLRSACRRNDNNLSLSFNTSKNNIGHLVKEALTIYQHKLHLKPHGNRFTLIVYY